jgi:transcriptional regulator with XRE-family HTH domain
MNDPESNPAGFLGAELRRARVAAGFASQEALAARLGYDRSVIAKAETGERPPSPEVADAIEAELFPAGPSGFVGRLAALARRAGGPIPSWFESWLEAERDAHMLRLWSRALFLATGLDEDAAQEHVAVRLGRQAILECPRPPHVVAVLDQSVLDRLIGSPQVMADQLMHIAELSERPNLSVQVIPADTGANAGLSGAFDLASSDGGPEVVRMEAVEDVTVESRSLVRKTANIFVRVQADALPRAASRALIMEAAGQWKTS